jgi:hypothetical protein
MTCTSHWYQLLTSLLWLYSSVANMAITKILASVLLLAAAISPAVAMPAEATNATDNQGTLSARACGCRHNNDKGRWDDTYDPAGRVDDLCTKGGGCWQGKAGRMCVIGDTSQCRCAFDTAKEEQNWDKNWWLWSAITCGDRLSITLTP